MWKTYKFIVNQNDKQESIKELREGLISRGLIISEETIENDNGTVSIDILESEL